MTILPATQRKPGFARGLAAALVGGTALLFAGAEPSIAQTQQQSPTATRDDNGASTEITSERQSPLLSVSRERESVVVPVSCAPDVRKDVELQPADASVTFAFDCLCSEDPAELKQAMMRYRDDYMRVYRKEISLNEMGTANEYFGDVALPFSSDGSGGTRLTMPIDPGEKEERTVYCYTAEDFKLIDDWARYIIFGN